MSTRNNIHRTTTQAANHRWGIILLAVIALAYLVTAVFWPVLCFQFVDFDVNDQLINNRYVHGLSLENVKHIVTSKCVSSYYPVRTLTLAMDYQFWGLRPGGFKLTNGVIHLANVLLVFWLILRLFRRPAAPCGPSARWWDVCIAALSAGAMAIHPLVVEPVVWVGGREELLMTLGALGCFHAHLSAMDVSEQGGFPGRAWPYHVLAFLGCGVACLSNAVGAVVPLLITAWDVLTLARPKLWRIVRGTAALWLLGAAAVVIKQVGYTGDTIAPLAPVFTAEWLALVLRTYWMNLTAIVWPTRLAVLYEWVRPGSFLEKEVLGGGAALLLTGVVLWKLRRRVLILFGLLWFGLALAPASQVMLHHVARADRYLYLPLAGLAMAGALALRPLGRVLPGRFARGGVIAAALLALLMLDLRTAQQLQTWMNSTTLWMHCIEIAPNNPLAHGCLADSLSRDGLFAEAIPHYEFSLQLEPDSVDSLNNYAIRLATCQEEHLRDHELAIQLAKRGCELSRWEDPQLRRTLAKAYANHAKTFHVRGQYQQAIAACENAMEADPDFDTPLFNLAMLLATCPDEALRQPPRAVRLAEKAVAMSAQPDPSRLRILATVQASAGQFESAITTANKAIRLAQDAGDAGLADVLRDEQRRYREGVPIQGGGNSR